MKISSKWVYLQLCISTCLLAPNLVFGADWPWFGGPAHDGKSTETGLLKDWPQAGPPLVWKTTGIGDGYASLVQQGQTLYTAGDKGETSFVVALNATDGKPIWSSKLGKSGPVGDPKFDGPRGTPTMDGGSLFMLGQWGDLVCFESNSGKEIWRKDLTKDFGGVNPHWGYSESPLVDGNQVVVTPGGSDGAMVALDKKTGAVIWRSRDFTDSPHYSSMIVEDFGGVRQYIQLTAASVAGIAAKDGKLLWKAPRKGNVAVIPSPVFKAGLVYVTSGYGVGCNCFKLTPADGKFTAEEVYANKVMVNHHGGVIELDGNVYGYSDGKGWTCQDLKSGEAKWQEKEKLGKGTILYADGRFYLRQEDKKGTLALIEASASGYKEHGRFDPPDRSSKNSWPHLSLSNGRLYVRDQDVLLCYDVKPK